MIGFYIDYGLILTDAALGENTAVRLDKLVKLQFRCFGNRHSKALNLTFASLLVTTLPFRLRCS